MKYLLIINERTITIGTTTKAMSQLEAILARHPDNKEYQQTMNTLATELASYNPNLYYSEDGIVININYKNNQRLPIPDYFTVHYFYYDNESPFAIQSFTRKPEMSLYQDIPSLMVAVKARYDS